MAQLLGKGPAARQWLSEHVPTAINTHATIEQLLDASFLYVVMPYQRKVGV
jgi:hypothetical protein